MFTEANEIQDIRDSEVSDGKQTESENNEIDIEVGEITTSNVVSTKSRKKVIWKLKMINRLIKSYSENTKCYRVLKCDVTKE